nr:EAL domain-containing protein [uncultured Desulfobulbus sp.]
MKRTRDYLAQQIESQTQESANFLGLALSSVQGQNELAIMETMIDALFDSGTYLSIELLDNEGQTRVARQQDNLVLPVPPWFSAQIDLPVPQAEAKVMRGWVQTGIVRIASRLDGAYQNLWQAARKTALWCGLTWCIFVVIGGGVLRSILQPLKRIEEQANALMGRRFDVQLQIPRTRELRRVVEAMNTMTTRIGQIFNEHAAAAEKLKEQVYLDPLTGLGNRRYLQAQIEARLADTANQITGTFILLQVQGLKAINDQHGYEQGDQILQDVATHLQVGCRRFSDAVLARLGGGDMAVFFPGVDILGVQEFWDEVFPSEYRPVHQPPSLSSETGLLAAGGVCFEDQAPSLSNLLAAADMALTQARSHGEGGLEILSLNGEVECALQGRMHYKQSILDLIADKNIIFYAQPTVQKGNLEHPLGHEVYARVIDSEGRHQSLAMYIAMAEQFGLAADLEQMIVDQLLSTAMRPLLPKRLALNISASSLADPVFFQWLSTTLGRCGREGFFFDLEFPEPQLHIGGERVREFADAMRQAGHGIGIDHFGQGLADFSYLQWLTPDYVKIDRAIADELLRKDKDVRFFIESLCSVAHSLGVQVVIKNVETEEQLEILAALNIDAMQGNALQPPLLLAG